MSNFTEMKSGVIFYRNMISRDFLCNYSFFIFVFIFLRHSFTLFLGMSKPANHTPLGDSGMPMAIRAKKKKGVQTEH